MQSKGLSRVFSQHHSSKASILRCSAFFMIQLSHPYMTTGKTVALTRRTFVGKVMSLLFNKLSRLVITFVPRSKHLFISWLQSPSAVILEPPKIKSDTVSPSICYEVKGKERVGQTGRAAGIHDRRQMARGRLLSSTGNSAQCSVTTWGGGWIWTVQLTAVQQKHSSAKQPPPY